MTFVVFIVVIAVVILLSNSRNSKKTSSYSPRPTYERSSYSSPSYSSHSQSTSHPRREKGLAFLFFALIIIPLCSSQSSRTFQLNEWLSATQEQKTSYVIEVLSACDIYAGFLASQGKYDSFALLQNLSRNQMLFLKESVFYMDDYFLHIIPKSMLDIPNLKTEAWKYVLNKVYEKSKNL